MKIIYLMLLLATAIFFNACGGNAWWNYTGSNAVIQSPEQIDSLAIPPSAENNLLSPPKNGYARLIMYIKDDLIGRFDDVVYLSYSIEKGQYQYVLKDHYYSYFFFERGHTTYEIANEMLYERALCRLKGNSSCIVNIKAGNAVMLYLLYSRAVIFTPKNQHIYCINMQIRDFLSLVKPKLNEYYTNLSFWNYPISMLAMNFEFKDKNTCLKEYKEAYRPEHKEKQEKWFNKLVKKGDKRAYRE